MSDPVLFFGTFPMCLFQKALYLRFTVQGLSLYEIIRYQAGRAVLLQRAPADFEHTRQFVVGHETVAPEHVQAHFLHIFERLPDVCETAQQVGYARVLPVNEIMAHSCEVFG